MLIEEEVSALPGVDKISVDHITGEAQVSFDGQKIKEETIFLKIEKLNYGVMDGQEQGGKGFWTGLLIPLGLAFFVGAYFLVKALGGFEILSQLNEGHVGYGLIFIIGLLAGFHCVGMCGGLVVTYTANHLKTKENRSLWPHFQYNAGRFLSYTIIGGILGSIGAFFAINPVVEGGLMLLAGAFMILMGLNLLTHWSILEKIKLRTPQFIAKYLYRKETKSKGPFLIGLMNGLMPCGPLQAMQLYALTTGSFMEGALSMGIYALGTIPMMFGLGAFISRIKMDKINNILKFSGALIIILGGIMLNRGLINFGYGYGLGGQDAQTSQDSGSPAVGGQEEQTVNMDLTYYGYQPNVLYIKKGIPVRWVINAKELSGCTNAIEIDSLGIYKDLRPGENVIEFTPPDGADEIKFSCGMKMVWGKFIIQN